MKDFERFKDLTYADFKRLAKDDSLTCYEKIGFPIAFRQGKEQLILEDMCNKATNLNKTHQKILDIGAGCSELPHKLITLSKTQHHELILLDSQEMLDLLPNDSCVTKISGFYPNGVYEFVKQNQQKIDVILAYSILHYIFVEANLFEFIDISLTLLADGGQMLIGDIPNLSKRKRFLNSAAGRAYHQTHYSDQPFPTLDPFAIEPGKIDDAVLASIINRCRAAGFDAYILPQPHDLPMANRREDLLIVKP